VKKRKEEEEEKVRREREGKEEGKGRREGEKKKGRKQEKKNGREGFEGTTPTRNARSFGRRQLQRREGEVGFGRPSQEICKQARRQAGKGYLG
jgi:hypothetical protein